MKIYENGKNWVIEDQLNPSLVSEISNILEKNHNQLFKDKEGYSTQGKNAEQYWIINSQKKFCTNNNEFYEFVEKYQNQILSRVNKSGLLDEETKNLMSLKCNDSWTVIAEEHSYHTIHHHNGYGYGISTVLYINVPDTNVEDEQDNNIFFAMNCGVKPRFYLNQPSCLTINPEVGKLLIFPDWILHGTYPQTKGIRQTFNMDFRIDIKEEKSKSIKYF